MADQMGLMGMAGAGGASDAMQILFAQRMEQAHLAQTDALTRLKLQEQADTVRARIEASRQAAADRAEAQKQANLARIDAQFKELPTDTPISAQTRTGLTGAGILPERMAPQPMSAPAPPEGIAAPGETDPAPIPGTVANSPAPNQVQFHRMPTTAEAAQQKMLGLFPVGSRERTVAEYEVGTGKNAPSSLMPPPPKPGVIHDTANGLMRFGEDNTGTPLTVNGKPAQGFHQPPPPIFYAGGVNGPALIDRTHATQQPITDTTTGEVVKAPIKPLPYQAAENVSGLNTAEVEGVKVLRLLHQDGLDQSNDPLDPRWQKFVVTTLKMSPGDFAKADIQQRTAYVNAALTRQLMGGRPSQYVAQLLQDHLPKGEMTGSQLAHVLSNVLEQAGEKRAELGQFLPGVKGPVSGTSYADYLEQLQGGGGGMVHMQAPDGRSLSVPAEKVAEMERLGAKKVP